MRTSAKYYHGKRMLAEKLRKHIGDPTDKFLGDDTVLNKYKDTTLYACLNVEVQLHLFWQTIKKELRRCMCL